MLVVVLVLIGGVLAFCALQLKRIADAIEGGGLLLSASEDATDDESVKLGVLNSFNPY